MARTIARHLNVPFSIVDATVFTEAGYVGEDVENIILNLLKFTSANYNNLSNLIFLQKSRLGNFRITISVFIGAWHLEP